MVHLDDDEAADIEAAIKLSLQQDSTQPGANESSSSSSSAAVAVAPSSLPGFSVQEVLKDRSSGAAENGEGGNSSSSSSGGAIKAGFRLPNGSKVSMTFAGDDAAMDLVVFAARQVRTHLRFQGF